MAKPLECHWAAISREFLSDVGLHIQPAIAGQPYSFQTFWDVDWAVDPMTEDIPHELPSLWTKSYISWWSWNQPVVEWSTTEIGESSSSYSWSSLDRNNSNRTTSTFSNSNYLLLQPKYNFSCSQFYFVFSQKTMYINLSFVQEEVLAKQLLTQHILFQDQWADVLTKPLSTI